MHLATDIILQFPFYGAIMGMMYLDGGLGSVLVNAITSVATAHTMPIFTFLSACLVNLFIPSQGGQFTVQGPLIVELQRPYPVLTWSTASMRLCWAMSVRTCFSLVCHPCPVRSWHEAERCMGLYGIYLRVLDWHHLSRPVFYPHVCLNETPHHELMLGTYPCCCTPLFEWQLAAGECSCCLVGA